MALRNKTNRLDASASQGLFATALRQRTLSNLPHVGVIHEAMSPSPHLLKQLCQASLTELCEGPVRDPVMAELVRAGLLLVSGGLQEAHGIVQRIDVPEASFWHAIVHRREPDWFNAAYWYRRLGWHSVFDELASPAIYEALPESLVRDQVLADGRWDPFRRSLSRMRERGSSYPATRVGSPPA